MNEREVVLLDLCFRRIKKKVFKIVRYIAEFYKVSNLLELAGRLAQV